MGGFDAARTGFNPFERDIGVANVGTLQEAWFQPKPAFFPSADSPIVSHGSLIARVRYGLLAYDAADGTPRWTATPGFEASKPAAGTDSVFVSNTHTLYAYDADGQTGCSNTMPATCTPIWISSVGGTIAGSPAVSGDSVFVATDLGVVQAYDTNPTVCPQPGPPAVCRFRWLLQLPSTLQGEALHLTEPAVGSGRIFVSSEQGIVNAIPVEGGVPGPVPGPEWMADLNPARDQLGSSDQRPTVAGGRVYVTWNNSVYVFDAAGVNGCTAAPSGDPRVCSPLFTYDQPWAFGLSVANGFVYTTGILDTTIRVYDAAGVTGCSGSPKVCEPLWTYSLTGHEGAGPPTVANGVVYLTTHGLEDPAQLRIHAFDAAGTRNCAGTPKVCTPLWFQPVGTSLGGTFDPPVVVNGMVHVAGSDGLHTYRLP